MNHKDENRICIGAFAGAHGVHGETKVKAFTATPSSIAEYGPVETEDGGQSFVLEFIRILKSDLVLVRSNDILSREMAIQLTGTRLYVAREKLPKTDDEDFYHADLVGLHVCLPGEDKNKGEKIGTIAAVHNFGAGDILEIKLKRIGREKKKPAHLVPFSLEAIPDVFINDGYVVLNPEFLPDEKPEKENEEK